MDTLELIYYISADPVLTIIAGLGLYQIKIAKENAKINAKRESYKLSCQQIEYYLNSIIPKINEMNSATGQAGLKNIGEWIQFDVANGISTLSLKKGFIKEFREFTDAHESFNDLNALCVSCMNMIESFSAPLAAGLASEEVAFSSVGRTHLNSMKRLHHVLFIVPEDYYRNTKKLYALWYQRAELADIERQSESMKSRIKGYNLNAPEQIGFRS